MNATKTVILLVEDNMDDAELTIRALRKSNQATSLTHVKDGEEALNFIFCQGVYTDRDITDTPQLVLLDLKMPKVDGIEVLKKIKSDERTKSIPVVMLTSSNEEIDIQHCYQLGANSYVVKPVEFEGFVQAVSQLNTYWLLLNQAPY